MRKTIFLLLLLLLLSTSLLFCSADRRKWRGAGICNALVFDKLLNLLPSFKRITHTVKMFNYFLN